MENTIDQALDALKQALTENANSGVQTSSFKFGDKVYNKGLLWVGTGNTKQLVLQDGPDRIFSSENIDLAKDRHFSINKVTVLDQTELGASVVKSNLKQVGTLKGLNVDGGLRVNQYMVFDEHTDRLGLGTEEPNAALSVNEDGIEVIIGTEDFTQGVIGTFASHDLNIKTDNTTRLKISAGGNIDLGNTNNPPIQASVHGKLSIGVNNPDPNVDLHVRGGIKFANRTHIVDSHPPQGGSWNKGDVVWNENPEQRKYIGWVCTKSGNPGIWNTFGEIR
jgi:hypothetical protein